MILIAYDGSDDAKAAIERVAELVSGQPAVVVTVWEPYAQLLTRYPAAGAVMAGDDAGQIDDASRATPSRRPRRARHWRAPTASTPPATGSPGSSRSPRHCSTRPTVPTRVRSSSDPAGSAGSARCCWAASRTRSSSTPTGRW